LIAFLFSVFALELLYLTWCQKALRVEVEAAFVTLLWGEPASVLEFGLVLGLLLLAPLSLLLLVLPACLAAFIVLEGSLHYGYHSAECLRW
jgi:hypothetical protein